MPEPRAALRARLLADAAHTGTLTALRLAVERWDLTQPRMPALRATADEGAWVARQLEKRRDYMPRHCRPARGERSRGAAHVRTRAVSCARLRGVPGLVPAADARVDLPPHPIQLGDWKC